MAICAECTYMDLSNGDIYGKFWCDKRCERHLATDPECYSFCRAYGRYSSTINNAIEYSNKYSGSSCYITTMMCKILRMNDNNEYLETLRNFRDNILIKDEQYKKLLVEYDIIGPEIARAMSNDPLKTKISSYFVSVYIIPITNQIKNKEYRTAIENYVEMTNRLKRIYGINNETTLEIINNADINKSGHGRYVQKKIAYN